MRDYGVNTGLRLPKLQFDKLDLMAKSLNVSRNKMVALLIDGAEVQTVPSVSVRLGKKTSRATEREDRIV